MVTIGDAGVGKTSLLVQFVDGTFSGNYMSTIGVDFKLRTVEIDEKLVKIQAWDLAGEERFRSITSSYYRGAAAILIVFDVTDRPTFERAQFWYDEVRKNADPNISLAVAGNKIDLIGRRVVSEKEAQQWADGLGVKYFETSAKDGTNVEAAYLSLGQDFMKGNMHSAADGIPAGTGGATTPGKEERRWMLLEY